MARAAPSAVDAVAADGGRDRSVDLDNDWRFALVNPTGITDPTGAFAGAQDPAFDDSSWRVVDLPHDWSIELDPTSGPGTGTNGGTGFLQGGLGWYRKTFTLAPSLAGKRLSVEFDGVYMDSSVYFNGQLVGSHPYGYTGFSVDLTPLARTDGTSPNVLAVKVQNQLPSSRWYSGSGIYRNVHLIVTDPVHVTRHGVFVTTPDLEQTVASAGTPRSGASTCTTTSARWAPRSTATRCCGKCG
jgi:beta-galactosidase